MSNDTLTVDDIIHARSTLRERATQALEDSITAQNREIQERMGPLIDETVEFLRDVLLCSDSELADVEFKPGPIENMQPSCLFKIADTWMKSSYMKQSQQIDTSHNMEILKLKLQSTKATNPTTGAWTYFSDLVSLGRLLS